MTFPLSPDDLREHVTTDLVDSALQRLLDFAEAQINARIGAPGARTEIVRGGSRYLSVSRPIATVTSITETSWSTTLSLASDDYRLRADGLLLERLRTGTNPRFAWHGDVTVVYDPQDDDARRSGVQIALCQLAADEHPGVQSERIGEWEQRFSGNSAWNATDEYESILSRLDPEPQMFTVGSSWGPW